MATHSSIFAWKMPQIEKPGRLQSMGVTKSQTPLSTHASNYLNEAKNNSLCRRNPLRTQIPTIQQSLVLLGNSQRQQGVEYHPGKGVVMLHNAPSVKIRGW